MNRGGMINAFLNQEVVCQHCGRCSGNWCKILIEERGFRCYIMINNISLNWWKIWERMRTK